LRRSANFKKNKAPENIAIQSPEMKKTLINDELDRDLENREKQLQEFNQKLEEISVESDEDTIYETMLDIQLRREDSKSFFDNEIQGIWVN
jgi:biopolymer transport protein ExbD